VIPSVTLFEGEGLCGVICAMLRRGSLSIRGRGWYLVLRESCTVESGLFPSPKLEKTVCSTGKAVLKECRKGHACAVAGGDILGTSFQPNCGAKFASPADRERRKTTILCVRPDTRHHHLTGPLVCVMSYPNAAIMRGCMLNCIKMHHRK
jgi:hypothetical protein